MMQLFCCSFQLPALGCSAARDELKRKCAQEPWLPPWGNTRNGSSSAALVLFLPTPTDKAEEVQSSAAPSADTGDHTVIQALLSNRTNHRLESVQRLLKHVVTTAGSVVRGTDSQRRFTSTYTDFCLSAVRSMADLEEAVFEHTHPGRRAADAADNEVEGITEDLFLKQVAAYVSAQTKSLGAAPYLEHVALRALEKHQQQQHKRERTASSSSAASMSQRPAKVSRKRKDQIGSGGWASTGGAAVVAAETASADSAFDSLGLIDAQDITRGALQALQQGKSTTAATESSAGAGGGGGGAADLKRRGLQAATAVAGTGYAGSRIPGLYVSKAAAAVGAGAAGAGNGIFDLRSRQLKLTTVPELATRLQPWITPLVTSGVYLDRVTMERERKGAGGGTTSTATTTATGNTSSLAEAVEPILDVCLAGTPMELLRHYENREAVLAAEPQYAGPTSPSSAVAAGGPYSVVPYAGRKGTAHGGGSPRSTTATPASPLLASGGKGESGAPPVTDVDGVVGSVAEPDVPAFSAFFPAVRENKPLTCLPHFVISNQAHFGVSRMEFVYAMAPPSK